MVSLWRCFLTHRPCRLSAKLLGKPAPTDLSPSQLRRHLSALQKFRRAYIDYLNATLEDTFAGNPIAHTPERAKLMKLAVKADEALAVANVLPVIFPAPNAEGKPRLAGLCNIALAHEDPTYRMPTGSWLPEPLKQAYHTALEAVDYGDGLLHAKLEIERRRRLNPLYWGDRLLRACLGFPAYLLSVIFRFDRNELSPGAERALTALSVTADISGVWAVGRALGWW